MVLQILTIGGIYSGANYSPCSDKGVECDVQDAEVGEGTIGFCSRQLRCFPCSHMLPSRLCTATQQGVTQHT